MLEGIAKKEGSNQKNGTGKCPHCKTFVLSISRRIASSRVQSDVQNNKANREAIPENEEFWRGGSETKRENWPFNPWVGGKGQNRAGD